MELSRTYEGLPFDYGRVEIEVHRELCVGVVDSMSRR